MAAMMAVGDTLRVLPGEAVPVDGIIRTGQTSINQAVMTGESLPVDKGPGDEVSSGTVNQFGSFDMRAAKVGENSSIQRMIRLVQSTDAGKAKIVGLADLKDEMATSLPYGKQRRLEIARALATEPKLLLLDEPAAGMNPQETDELTAFIRETRDRFGLTVFLIEHHMDLVMDISDRIYVIDFGRQIASGVPSEIQNNPRVIDAYLGVDDDE